MVYSKPILLVISGPNGAGKSTYINYMLSEEFGGIESFDRDKIRCDFEKQLALSRENENQIAANAMRLMEEKLQTEMNNAILARKNFVLETPLSHPDYWKYIDRFQSKNYEIRLKYLGLDKIKDCEARVEQRVREGGHHVDATTIKGVYETNLKYINDFKETFKVIELYDGMKKPTLLVQLEDNLVTFATENALKKSWIKSGLPAIARAITQFLA